ncbi:MAG: aminopeptidase N [Alphaproteobacteria bacterium]|nr:aminopeptidase N [Alphaproteobacteria bacterium]
MRADTPPTIHLKDYKVVPYQIDSVDLEFNMAPHATRVTSRIALRPNPLSKEKSAPLVFDGEKLTLLSVTLDGRLLGPKDYAVSDSRLIIAMVPQKPFALVIETECDPKGNTALTGLYMSNGMYCTQCEAQGFRRITYFYDRPDVMTVFTVRIEAPKTLPVLLSNGNPGKTGAVDGERHFAVWHDPHPKPSYLFALVAGDLAHVKSNFTTSEGRKVKLGIYVEKGKEGRCAWAMEALKASMRWDETAFGRAYDLDVFNIVAVSDFNMGAMENKGLNIFNDKYILALPETATDTDYVLIEAIIAHEYFHNWTGNRITCRDWFQLCLKEGLTVFRDQEFTSDMRSRAVKRIEDVKTLRARQFPEDQGPLQHPVRPSSYIEINNFYTPTVYEKGAELCRMMKALIGPKAFARAMKLYFKRHDGEAATVEDFVACMADASGRDMTQFFRWYNQAGTPKVSARGDYDAKRKTFTLEVKQTTPRLKGQKVKLPLHFPLALGLVSAKGKDMPLELKGQGAVKSGLIEVTQAKQSFTFVKVAEKPVLSLNRGFSAPIVLKTNVTEAEQLFLIGHDADPFNRWEAAQTVGKALILKTIKALAAGRKAPSVSGFADALGKCLANGKLDEAFKALMLSLPSEADLAAAVGKEVDSEQVYAAREHVRRNIAKQLAPVLRKAHDATHISGPYKPDTQGTAQRSLRYVLLSMIAGENAADALALAAKELHQPDNMTAEIGVLQAVKSVDGGQAMLEAFHSKHKDDHLLIDKWFMMNATIAGADAARRVKRLLSHPDFKMTTPNRVYALVANFANNNATGFHAASGEGYAVVADVIVALNAINPQVAARLSTAYRSWRLFDVERRAHAQREMQRILATPNLSNDVFEIISRTLQA